VSLAVVFDRAAQDDLDDLFEWIADRSSVATAKRYTDRLRDYCLRFDAAPERGTRRDDLRPGVRIVGFERRVTVLFTVTDSNVVILRLFYGGQDFERLLEE
jgi:toxin ParE1/3/4